MPRATTNKSMRVDRPIKQLRRTPTDQGESDESGPSGAGGRLRRSPRRPGRAASLLSSGQRTRSQRWRSPKKGKRTMRRGNLVKRGAKRTAK